MKSLCRTPSSTALFLLLMAQRMPCRARAAKMVLRRYTQQQQQQQQQQHQRQQLDCVPPVVVLARSQLMLLANVHTNSSSVPLLAALPL
jgi:hypothetical protein